MAFQKGASVSPFNQSQTLDAAEILRSVGDVVYEWRLDTDGLTWSDNASALLGVDVDEIGTGRAFAQHVDAARGPTRIDVIQQTTRRETGNGVPYQIQYAFKRGDEKIWLEDIGRWFAASTASRCVRTVLSALSMNVASASAGSNSGRSSIR